MLLQAHCVLVQWLWCQSRLLWNMCPWGNTAVPLSQYWYMSAVIWIAISQEYGYISIYLYVCLRCCWWCPRWHSDLQTTAGCCTFPTLCLLSLRLPTAQNTCCWHFHLLGLYNVYDQCLKSYIQTSYLHTAIHLQRWWCTLWGEAWACIWCLAPQCWDIKAELSCWAKFEIMLLSCCSAHFSWGSRMWCTLNLQGKKGT